MDDRLNWLDEFEQLADQSLEQGSDCKRVHPIIAAWLDQWIQQLPGPAMRPAENQAICCLTTEMLKISPLPVMVGMAKLSDNALDEIVDWVKVVLLVGYDFQKSLSSAELPDL